MEESKKVYVHYEGSPEYTHVARITWGLTVEQLAREFARVYNAKHGRMFSLNPDLIHLLNGKRRMSKSANLIRLVNDRSDIFVEREIPTGGSIGGSLGHTIGQNSSSTNEEEKIPKPKNEDRRPWLKDDDRKSRFLEKERYKSKLRDRESKFNISKLQAVSPLEKVSKTEVTSRILENQQEAATEADLASAVERIESDGQELREPFICALLVSAVKNQQSKKFRSAQKIFLKVLEKLPKQQICLRGLGSIALELHNYSKALEWLQRGVEDYPKDVLFHARLGDAYSGLKKYDEALSEYDLALGLVTELKPVQGTALTNLPLNVGLPTNLVINYDPKLVEDPNAGDIQGTITVDGLKISSAVALGKRGDIEDALTVLKSVLTQSAENLDALYEYGSLILGLGHVKDALKIFLKLLVSRSESKRVRSMLSKAIKQPEGMDLLKKEVPREAAAAPVLAYLASCVKDYGGIDEAVELYNLAIELSPSMGYYLNLIHLYEMMYEYLKALGLAVSLFESVSSFSLNKLQFSDVLPLFQSSNWTESPDNISQQFQEKGLKFQARAEFFRWFDGSPVPKQLNSGSDPQDWPEESKKEETNCAYSDEELDALAVLFTATKILYVGGALERARQLARLVEPARIASVKPLHQTLIRNEAAYFTCVQQILEQHAIPLPLPSLKEQAPLFLAGDSHCLSAAWRPVRLRGQSRLLVPMLVTGLKVWHLRPESQFYPKYAFENVMLSVADGAQMVMIYGEIDCRESILASVEKGIYQDVEQAVEVVVKIYLEVLQQLIFSRGFELFVHPVPPVLNETRQIVHVFNRILKQRLEHLKENNSVFGKRLHWLDFALDFLNAEGFLRDEYKLDGTHLSPKYCSLLRRELQKFK